MTEIVYEKSNDAEEVTVFGHCNAGRINGMDLCCCGVSMLIFTMLDSLKKLHLKKFRYSYGGGWCHIYFTRKDKNCNKAACVVNTVMNGFELLKKKYPKNINIILKNKGAYI